MKKPFVIHPFLFAIFSILFLFAHNIGEVSFSEIVLPTTVILAFTALSVIFLGLILRDSKKAGIIVSIFLILFFSYGHVYVVTSPWRIGGFAIGRHRYILALWGALFTCGAYFIIRTGKQLHNLTKILNVATASLVLISLINIVSYELKTRVAGQYTKGKEDIKTATIDSRKDVLPDIYYIILDSYARADVLREIYNFDNSDFISYLSDKGFYVASESNANYPATILSLPSSLNMEYIDDLIDTREMETSRHWRAMYPLLQDYKVQRFLRSKGYKYIHFGALWQPTCRNKYADININLYLLPEFSSMLYRSTLLYPVLLKLGIYDLDKEEWRRVLYKFDKLAEIPKIEEPTFVFAHMSGVHEPYIFDRNGNFLTKEETNKRTETENYVNQLIFVNKKVKELIDSLLSQSETLPIIILQSDEGPHPLRYQLNFFSFNWKQATKAEFRGKTGILNAYHLPHVDKNVLYPSITPVNSFRLIFNLYFNTHLELLPDESYIVADRNHPYKFFNVTDKVK